MGEFIGLILFGAGIALIAITRSWFARHPVESTAFNQILGEVSALTIVFLLIGGGALVGQDLARAWGSQDFVHVALALGMLVAFVFAARLAGRWLTRSLVRAGAVPTA